MLSQVQLFRDFMDCSLPGSSGRGISQKRILEWAAMPSSRGSSRPRGGTRGPHISCTGRRILHLGSRVLYIYKPKLGKIYIYLSLSKLFILIIFSVLHCLGLSFLHVGISSYTSQILEVLNIGSSFQGQVINWHYSRQIETHSAPNHQFSSVQLFSLV